jgi:hypothetical protein
MKRWLTALVAVLVLSTATLHVLEHLGVTDTECAVCAVTQAGSAGMATPSVVIVPVPSIDLPSFVCAFAHVVRGAACAARAPPALPA